MRGAPRPLRRLGGGANVRLYAAGASLGKPVPDLARNATGNRVAA